MAMPGRKYEPASGYRYGFNGKEKDKDISAGGQDYGMRVYDSRLGKFLSLDPLVKKYPFYSPYQFAGNIPIRCIDLDGGEPLDRIENWQGKQMIVNDSRRSNVEVEYSPAMGVYSYEAIYDKVSEQYWFVMHNQDGSWAYWKHNEGADRTLLRQSTTGKYDNGHWENFETANEIDARAGAASANFLSCFFVAIFTAPFAIEAYGTTSAIAGTTYVGRGVFDASTDAAAQLATNGGDPSKINRTSIVLSFFVPGHSIKTLLAKNAVANYAKWTGKGYEGIGSEGYGIDNFVSDGTNTLIGTVTDKFFAKVGNRPTASSTELSRWANLSYKPKYANLIQQNNRNIKINNFFNSWQGKTLTGIVTNTLQGTGSNDTPKQDPNNQLGFH